MRDLPWERCRELLNDAPVAHMAVIAEGEPYVSPISFVLVGDSICIRTGEGKRVDALRENPRVCIEVSAYDGVPGDWESVILWGTAQFVEDDRSKQEVIFAFLEKYRDVLGSPLNPDTAFGEPGVVICIPIEDSSGRGAGDYLSVRRRPGRL
ncbi:MAG: pyridoxamine 5'-phosphate oxidase family protein [Actinomycetota bacterium]